MRSCRPQRYRTGRRGEPAVFVSDRTAIALSLFQHRFARQSLYRGRVFRYYPSANRDRIAVGIGVKGLRSHCEREVPVVVLRHHYLPHRRVHLRFQRQ